MKFKLPFFMLIFLLLGMFFHLIVKVFEIIELAVPDLFDALCIIFYLLYTIIYSIFYIEKKRGSYFLFITVGLSFILLYSMTFFNILSFSNSSSLLAIFKIPIPIILWFFILTYNGFRFSDYLLKNIDNNNKVIKTIFSSLIITSYLLVTFPLIQQKGLWGAVNTGRYFETPVIIYVIFFFFFIILRLSTLNLINYLQHKLSKFDFIFFSWLNFMAIVGIYTSGLYGLSIIVAFCILPYYIFFINQKFINNY